MSLPGPSVIGHEAPRFVEFLIQRIREIETIKVFRPPPGKPIQQEPSLSDKEQALIAEALAVRHRLNLPFWDSLLLQMSTHPVRAESVLRRATLHNPQDFDSFSVHRNDCREVLLRQFIASLPAGRILAISSRVVTTLGEVRHLPMLDFHCPASPECDHLVKGVVMELGLRGYIARSGRSYHFYGSALIDEQALITFLGKSLLFCPIVDRAWIAHQLLERACGLRISPGKEYSRCPEIIDEI